MSQESNVAGRCHHQQTRPLLLAEAGLPSPEVSLLARGGKPLKKDKICDLQRHWRECELVSCLGSSSKPVDKPQPLSASRLPVV